MSVGTTRMLPCSWVFPCVSGAADGLAAATRGHRLLAPGRLKLAEELAHHPNRKQCLIAGNDLDSPDQLGWFGVLGEHAESSGLQSPEDAVIPVSWSHQ